MYDKTLDNNLSFASGIYLFIIFTIFMPVSKNLSVMIILLYLYKHATLKRYTFGYSSMSVYIYGLYHRENCGQRKRTRQPI